MSVATSQHFIATLVNSIAYAPVQPLLAVAIAEESFLPFTVFGGINNALTANWTNLNILRVARTLLILLRKSCHWSYTSSCAICLHDDFVRVVGGAWHLQRLKSGLNLLFLRLRSQCCGLGTTAQIHCCCCCRLSDSSQLFWTGNCIRHEQPWSCIRASWWI